MYDPKDEISEAENRAFKRNKEPLIERECLNCDRKFMARGRTNRICKPCKTHQPTGAVDWIVTLGKKLF